MAETKSTGSVLFEDVKPAEGAPLHEPLTLWRKHQVEADRLEALLAERTAQLEAAWREERQPLSPDSDPAGMDAHARVSRLQAIVGEIEKSLGKERTAATRARGQAQSAWATLSDLERRHIIHTQQAEKAGTEHARAVAAGNAKKRLEELEATYKATTGIGYNAGACGVVASWEPPAPGPFDELLRAYKEAWNEAQARSSGLSDADRYQTIGGTRIR